MDYVRKWLDSYPRDAKQRKRRQEAMERFREFVGRDPVALLEKALETTHGCEEVEDVLSEYYRRLQGEGCNERSARQWVSVVKAFFTKNGARLGRVPLDTLSQRHYPPTSTLDQGDVEKMIQKRDNIQDQLVIAFLAQTGQRIGVLTAMKKGMIKEEGPKAFPYGLVEVRDRDLVNRDGRNVNKSRIRYRFVIGRETMQLVKKMPDYQGGWLFDIAERQMGRIVDEAADAAGIQRRIATGIAKRFIRTVHPNAFRPYWKNQMKQGEVKDSDMLEFLMGNKLPYDGASDIFSAEKVLNAYKTAERKLELHFRPASRKRRGLGPEHRAVQSTRDRSSEERRLNR
jgi:integrase